MAGPDQEGMEASLKSLAERLGIPNRVHWPGLVGGKVKWGALLACDAFVLPSHQENFGISVVEALSVGRPVLVSNQVNIWPEIEAHAWAWSTTILSKVQSAYCAAGLIFRRRNAKQWRLERGHASSIDLR